MQITKFGHSCIAAAVDGETVVVDPGAFTKEDALAGASAVLITHEHADHFVEARIREAVAANPQLQVYANPTVAGMLSGLGSSVHAVGAGDAFTVAGIDVQVYGEWHAVIHPDLPRVKNVGYLIGGALFHPGDALTVPDTSVDTLMLPIHAPWSKISEVIDYVRAVAPTHSVAVHDGLLNETGLGLVGNLLGGQGPGIGPSDYARLNPVAELTV
jgi:L-ascorbate metabolism protein UlaG (beta-lactamase superfamily)